MNDSDSTGPAVGTGGSAGQIDPAALYERIIRQDPVTILDVRVTGDFDTWRIDGASVEISNQPYYDYIEDAESAVEAAPDGDPLVVVCAEGEASNFVAGKLTEAGNEAVSLENGMEGWANLYEAIELPGFDGPGTVLQYHRPATGCLSYLVVSDGEAAVIDPLRTFTDRYRQDAADRGADLEYAIDTHCHADHVSGMGSLAETGVTGIVPKATVARGMDIETELTTIDHGDSIQVGDVTIDAVHTPGHTTGMTSYRVGDEVLLTGDSLFVGSVARPDLEAGDDGAPEAARELYESLQERILAHDADVIVAGGHRATGDKPGDDGAFTATIRELRESMAPLSMDEETFVDHILSNMPPRPANYETIIDANLGHRAVDDEEAFRIELGPNNCAASQGATGD